MHKVDDLPLFEPTIILPAQASAEAPWVGETAGPIALMLAVLEEAARCIERGRRRRHPGARKLAAEAATWFRSDSREWPFAFASICDVIGLDVEAARARFLGDETYAAAHKRVPVWSTPRGPGRTSIRPARASRAA